MATKIVQANTLVEATRGSLLISVSYQFARSRTRGKDRQRNCQGIHRKRARAPGQFDLVRA